jgi:hypothetical protein
MAVRADIERAVVATLSPLLTASGGYLAAIEVYRGELDEASLDQVFELIAGRVPAILVATGVGRYRSIQVQRRRASQDLRVELLLLSGSLRSLETRTHGEVPGSPPQADPGIYQMIEDVRARLFASDLGLDGVGLLEPHDEVPLLQRPELSVWRVAYDVTVDAFQPALSEAGPDLTEVGARVNLAGAPANPVVETTTETT